MCAQLVMLMIVLSAAAAPLKFQTVNLTNQQPPLTIQLAYRPDVGVKHPAILMLGSVTSNNVPFWSTNLLNEGFMLAAFWSDRPPDPDPQRRAQWLYFDQRFAHTYVQAGKDVPEDSARVIDYLRGRGDVGKIGWVGSSSTGIPGLAVATREKRLDAIVAFVSTGAYAQWLETWHENKLWRGKTNELWPDTKALLAKVDPILHVNTMYPCAVLMVSGGEDKIVDAKTARSFVDAARPVYKDDPERLRLVVYEGFGHNLPADIVEMYVEHWFHRYLGATNSMAASPSKPKSLEESAARTSVTGADHKEIMKAK